MTFPFYLISLFHHLFPLNPVKTSKPANTNSFRQLKVCSGEVSQKWLGYHYFLTTETQYNPYKVQSEKIMSKSGPKSLFTKLYGNQAPKASSEFLHSTV